MATVAFHIYSDFKPEDHEKLELGPAEEDEEEEELDESVLRRTFGLSKRVLNPPRFVPATVTSEFWQPTNTTATSSSAARNGEASIGGWYASLKRSTPSASTTPTPRMASPVPRRTVVTEQTKLTETAKEAQEKKNDWFIARALQASKVAEQQSGTTPSSRSETPPAAASTLADILARDPPPLPSQEPYVPPVWLAIGPGNRGFDMLERSGWKEGQALGRTTRAREGLGYSANKSKEKGLVSLEDEHTEEIVKKEIIDLSALDGEVVDLTVEDEEVDIANEFLPINTPKFTAFAALQDVRTADLDHDPRALITPLPTVLKSDRLGIGLKAKMVGTGIHKEPVRRVTHGKAAMAAHIRSNEDLRKMKKLVGRGHRGFKRLMRIESERRKDLLAYLNAD